MIEKSTLLSYYKRKDIQQEIIANAKNREIAIKFGDKGFGPRPDILQYPGDILEIVIGIKKVGENTARDIELRVSIPNLGIEKDVPEFDLRKNYVEKTVRRNTGL